MSRLLRKVLREPLVHFFAVALVLFAIGQKHEDATDPYRIVLTPEREAQLAKRYALQFGTPPDAGTQATLVEQELDEEVLFRQGLALGLDKDDELVRRRVVQKMRFLVQDLNPPAEPSDAELNAYFASHAARYAMPARTTFSHLYFSTEQGEPRAIARARKALDALAAGTRDPADPGDPFPDLNHFSAYESAQVQRLFGPSEMAEAAFSVPIGRWAGPFKSSYGWHLIHVDSRQEPARPPLQAVRERVRTDYLLDAQEQANKAAFDRLARGFTVVRAKS